MNKKLLSILECELLARRYFYSESEAHMALYSAIHGLLQPGAATFSYGLPFTPRLRTSISKNP